MREKQLREVPSISPVWLPLSDNMGHDAPRHRGVDCVDARDCCSYVLRPVMFWRPLWDHVFPA